MRSFSRKKSRLKIKYSNIIGRDFGLVMSDFPTKNIIICNGGLSNGITHEMVCEVFGRFDNMEEAIMVPGKSYCFVKYQDEMSARKAFDQIDGELIWSKINGLIHLGYVKEVNSALLRQGKIFTHPPGLILIDDFVTEEEETLILNLVEFDKSENDYSALKHRKVKHFGYEFDYTTNRANEPVEKIPDELNFLWERLKNHFDKDEPDFHFVPDQLTVNFYEPGQGIPPHVDTHSAFEDKIISLSLLSSIVMEFKNCSGTTYNVLLKRRSLCLMLGESRYDWTHGITPRKSDLVPMEDGSLTVKNREKRISLTFRKTRSGNCECKYPSLCDTSIEKFKLFPNSVSNMKSMDLKSEEASRLEGNYVHKVYDKIASHFSETRHKPWPNVQKFVDSFPTGSILVDVGCGNGKYFSNQNERFEIGCDSNSELIRFCREKEFECFTCNCLKIPIRDGLADGCICIAVIHHLTTEERRMNAIEEMIRILRRKGRLLIYVWAKNQEMDGKKSNYLSRRANGTKSKLPENEEESENGGRFELIPIGDSNQEIILPVHQNRTGFRHNDLLVPWKLNNSNESVFYRFYHVYEDDELRNSCSKLKNVDVLDYYYDHGNWCILLQKK